MSTFVEEVSVLDYKGYRVKIVALAVVLTVVLLVAGARLADLTMVHRPLDRVLENHAGIYEYDTFTRNGVTMVMVRLGEVPDWPSFYRSLGEEMVEVLGQRPFELLIEDTRNDLLTEAYQHMHFILQEAVVRGNFVEMAELISSTAERWELDGHRLSVDDEHVFLELQHGSNRLYEVVGRLSERSDS